MRVVDQSDGPALAAHGTSAVGQLHPFLRYDTVAPLDDCHRAG